MTHVILIFLIIISIYSVYGTWFKDWARKHYEIGYIPGPKSLNTYKIMLKVYTLLVLLGVITMYVLFVTGAFN